MNFSNERVEGSIGREKKVFGKRWFIGGPQKLQPALIIIFIKSRAQVDDAIKAMLCCLTHALTSFQMYVDDIIVASRVSTEANTYFVTSDPHDTDQPGQILSQRRSVNLTIPGKCNYENIATRVFFISENSFQFNSVFYDARNHSKHSSVYCVFVT